MSKIYGFGNALVDIEIQIDEDQLTSIGIPKGSMKHIDLNEKKELLKIYKDSIQTKNPGGSIANSLFAAESFGASTCFSCFLGDDENGIIEVNGEDGFGIYSKFYGEVLEPVYNSIQKLELDNKIYFLAKRQIPEAKLLINLLVDFRGEVVINQALDLNDISLINCK